MITLHTSGKHFELDDKIREYLDVKIGGLDHYMPHQVHEAHGTVILEHYPSGREADQYSCETTINLPRAQLQAKAAALTMFAAIDAVEAKLKAQLAKYKDRYDPQRPHLRDQLVDLSRQIPPEN